MSGVSINELQSRIKQCINGDELIPLYDTDGVTYSTCLNNVIFENSVSTRAVQENAITNDELADCSVSNNNICINSIYNCHLFGEVVAGNNICQNSITNYHIDNCCSFDLKNIQTDYITLNNNTLCLCDGTSLKFNTQRRTESFLFHTSNGNLEYRKATGDFIDLNINLVTSQTTPVGTIVPVYLNDIPEGWLLCDGTEFDINLYSELFEILGDNKTPKLNGRTIIGAGQFTSGVVYEMGDIGGNTEIELKNCHIPSHNHNVNVSGTTDNDGCHCHSKTNTKGDHDHGGKTCDDTHSHGNVPQRRKDVDRGDTGGSSLFSLDDVSSTGSDTHSHGIGDDGNHSHTVCCDGSNHSHGLNLNVEEDNVGDNTPHNNMQPYFTLKYIIKAKRDTVVNFRPTLKNGLTAKDTDEFVLSLSATELGIKLNDTLENNADGVGVANNSITSDKLNPSVFDKIYPIGSVYINATDNRNPNQLFGFGSWQKIGSGRVLVGEGQGTDINNVTSNFNLGQVGGEYEHTLTVSEMPAHKHGVNTRDSSSGQVENTVGQGDQGRNDTGFTTTPIESVGGGEAHNNMSPYITVYMWKRTA